jgi:hypothetical protein
MDNMLDAGKAMRNVKSPCTERVSSEKEGSLLETGSREVHPNHMCLARIPRSLCNVVMANNTRHASKLSTFWKVHASL